MVNGASGLGPATLLIQQARREPGLDPWLATEFTIVVRDASLNAGAFLVLRGQRIGD
ncbi:MAG: hypothetical protein AAF628_12980 [Planctomycetota bacterium]